MLFKASLFLSAALVAGSGIPDVTPGIEWAGIFKTPEAKYVWISQSIEGAYADANMRMVFISTADAEEETLESEALEAKAKAAWELAGNCPVATTNAEIVPSGAGHCFTLTFDTNLHTTLLRINTANAKNVAIYAQHVPTEFERSAHYLQDMHGEDVEPEAELPHVAAAPKPDKPWGKTIGATFLVAICTLIGVVFVVPVFNKIAQAHPRALFAVANAFASGALLAAAFYLMLYEATHLIIMDKEAHATAWWGSMILLGFITANILDTAVQTVVKSAPAMPASSTDAESGDTKAVPAHASNPNKLRVLSGVLLGDFVHNFVDGIIIGAAFLGTACDDNIAWGITAATVGHELAQEMSDYLVLTDPNQGALKPVTALGLNFISGLSVVLGAVVILATDVDNRAQGMLLAYGGGVYVQIGAAECMARVNEFATNTKLRAACLAAFTFGAAAIGLVLLSHEHCSGDEAGAAHAH